MDYINSHTTSLSTDLKLDPESRSRSRTVRPTKGGGGREGWNMWVILYMHNINSHTTSLSTTFKPDPESRAPPENIVLCRKKQKKCLNIRISKDQ